MQSDAMRQPNTMSTPPFSRTASATSVRSLSPKPKQAVRTNSGGVDKSIVRLVLLT
jgi:hypothetical protein